MSGLNQYIGPWSELVFWSVLSVTMVFAVYGVRAACNDAGVSSVVAARASAARDRWSRFRQRSSKSKRAAMARRWIKLSDEILAEFPGPRSSDFRLPRRFPNMTEEQLSALWAAESDNAVSRYEDSMIRGRRLFLARIEQARQEMVAEGIAFGRNEHLMLFAGEVHLFNTHSCDAWATKLGGEGHRILAEMGVDYP